MKRRAAILFSFSVFACVAFLNLQVRPPTSEIIGSVLAEKSEEKLIIVITATYPRPAQLADVIRLCNTLKNVPSVLWILSEDSTKRTPSLEAYLEQGCGVPYIHLTRKTEKRFSNGKIHGRGVDNRNEALRWIREKSSELDSDAVIYFADDDNAYDLRLFEELRKTQKIAFFPVGGIGVTGVSSPVVHSNGTLIGYHDPFIAKRKYVVDMAGFAVSLQMFLKSESSFPHRTGYLEDGFLRKLRFEDEDIQYLADNCTSIFAWHVRTEKVPPILEAKVKKELKEFITSTNLEALFKNYTL